MIDPSRFVYVTLNRHDELTDVVREELARKAVKTVVQKLRKGKIKIKRKLR